MTDTVWTFDWGSIRGEVAARGGMLGPVWFTLSDGRKVQPFAVAPWADDPPEKRDTLPPILQRLRGEFPCVPFGVATARTDLPPHWMDGLDPTIPPADDFAHGYSANHCWHLVEQTSTAITIAIDYPEDHVVRRLTRCISRGTGEQIKLDLHIEMHRDAALPIGLHPIFALPGQAGAAQLSIPSLTRVRTFPVPVDDASQCMPDTTTDTLTQIQTKDGSGADVTRLPLAIQTEELLAVSLTEGDVRLSDLQNRFAVDLSWDIATFPQCLLWLSNRGRKAYPWSGRFCAIGIEPVAAAFDLGVAHSANSDAPLPRSGIATQTPLSASEPFTTRYAITVSEL
ncbi:hypothetical protein AB3Y40_03045 [Yoonia sp. R2331]|uniref:hypothetical protein n=1 Tax=Yoonia sp. R2331 TaxID=3237238 RepID=UPI0034E5DB39